MRRPRAFTLVELLVSIALVALLLAIVLPALRGSRLSAQRTACLVNLRSLVSALQLYGDDQHALPVSSAFIGIATHPGAHPPDGLDPNRVRLQLPEALETYTGTALPSLTDGVLHSQAPWLCPSESLYAGEALDGRAFYPDGFSYSYDLGVPRWWQDPSRPFDIYALPDIPTLGREALLVNQREPSRVILADERPFHTEPTEAAPGSRGSNAARFDGSAFSGG
jgi:prepilin-type N-terminal cleavage/methylation domain-containing protein